jgi:hypothetical protein
MTYREKMICGTLLSTLTFCIWILWRGGVGDSGWSMLGAVVVLALIHICYAIAVTLLSRREPIDERDKLIEYKSFKIAYMLLIGLGFTWLLYDKAFGVTSVANIPMTILFLAILGGVEVVRLGVQLTLYRVGVAR